MNSNSAQVSRADEIDVRAFRPYHGGLAQEPSHGSPRSDLGWPVPVSALALLLILVISHGQMSVPRAEWWLPSAEPAPRPWGAAPGVFALV